MVYVATVARVLGAGHRSAAATGGGQLQQALRAQDGAVRPRDGRQLLLVLHRRPLKATAQRTHSTKNAEGGWKVRGSTASVPWGQPVLHDWVLCHAALCGLC